MEWDTDYDTPSFVTSRECSSSGWPDPADLASALMAVPSLSDSLAAAQSSSPARKRKLFGSSGSISPSRVTAKNTVLAGPQGVSSGRQLAGLPSSKRARMSHSHPLSRTQVSSSPPRQQQSPVLKQHPQLLRRRSPSPVQSSTILRSASGTGNRTPTMQDERTCISCRRTATSLLQLAKFHKCSLCASLSCPVCSRTCQVHDDEVQPEDTTKKHRTIHTKDDDDDDASYEDVQDTASVEEETGVYKHPQACGKPVCRGCSVESPDGTVQCYRCHAAPPH